MERQWWLRFANWVVLVLYLAKVAFLVFIVFVMPDDECFRWGAFDYATSAIVLYAVGLLFLSLRAVRNIRAEAVLLALSLVGFVASFLVWDLPQSRVRCDGTILPAPTGR